VNLRQPLVANVQPAELAQPRQRRSTTQRTRPGLPLLAQPLLAIFGSIRRCLSPARICAESYALSATSAHRHLRGLARGLRVGGTASTRSSATRESCVLAWMSLTVKDTPCPLVNTWRFEPALGLSVGFRPVLAPKNCAHGGRIQHGSRKIALTCLAHSVQKHPVDLLPHPCALSVPQAPPASHAASAAHLVRQVFPGMSVRTTYRMPVRYALSGMRSGRLWAWTALPGAMAL